MAPDPCGRMTRSSCFMHAQTPNRLTAVTRWVPKLVARAKRTGKRSVLVIANGRPFDTRLARAALETASPWVRPFKLPRYTSETLNWIEDFWEHLKDTCFTGATGTGKKYLA